MSVVELLASLAQKDIRLWLEGDALRFSAPEGAFTAEIKTQVVARKPEIIEFLKQAQKTAQPGIPKADRSEPLPASYSQQRLWVLHQINPRDITYNMPTALRIRGPMDAAVLERVFARIIERHEVLRTTFAEQDGLPTQIVHPYSGWQLPVTDLTDMLADERQNEVMRWVQREAATPFDLETGPLFRARLLVVDADASAPEQVLLATMHHSISDAWSMDVLVKDLTAFYMAEITGQPALLPELPIQYADYAVWQRQWIDSPEMTEQLAYWQQHLAGAPPVLRLPADKPRPDILGNHGAFHGFALTEAQSRAVLSACQRWDITPYMFLLGTWQVLLGRYANTLDVVVGAPIAGRDRSETQDLIGFFVNMVLFRADLSGRPAVKAYFQRIKGMVLGGFQNQEMPIDKLLETMDAERQPGHSPLAQAAFQLATLDDKGPGSALLNGPLQIEELAAEHVSARLEMVLGMTRRGEQLTGNLEFNTDLFHHATVATMMDQFCFLCEQLARRENDVLDDITLFDDAFLLKHLGYHSLHYRLSGLSANQLSMILDDQANPETRQNTFGIHCRLPGVPDQQTLLKAIQDVEQQAPELAARLVACELPAAEDFYWLIPAPREGHQAHLDTGLTLQVLHKPELKGSGLLDYINSLLHRHYDLLHERLVNYYLVVGDDECYLAIGCHHAVLDGAAVFLHMQRVIESFAGHSSASETNATPTGAWQAYLDWDRQHTDQPDTLTFWQSALQGVEALSFTPPVSPSPLPVSSMGDRVLQQKVEYGLTHSVRHYCADHGVSLPDFFKAIYAMVLQHYCRAESDFALFEFNAQRQDPRWQAALGCFYQQFPVIIPAALWQPGATIEAWFAHLKAFRQQSRPHRAISLRAQNRLVPRSRAVFMYNFYHFVQRAELDGTQITPYLSAPKVDGGVQFIVRDLDEALELELRYDVSVFDDLRLLDRVVHLANQICSEEYPTLDSLAFLSAQEQQWLWQAGQGAQKDLPANTILDQFAEQVRQRPDAAALIEGDQRLTYSQLDQRANRIAHWLLEQGVTANDRVGILLDRSSLFVEAIWGVLKAGAAYVPMDANYPAERLAYLVEDSQAGVILSRQCLLERIPATEATVLALDAAPTLAEYPGTAPDISVSPDHLIYVIYTSGSTGQPKGAAVTHAGERNLQQWYLHDLQFDTGSQVLWISAAGFDLTQKNLFAPLLSGGSLVIPVMDLYDEQVLIDTLKAHPITHINAAPSAFYPLLETALEYKYQPLHSVRYVILGGEPIQLNRLEAWLVNEHCQAQIVNSYGPTECTDVVAAHKLVDVSSAAQGVPLGSPINNVQLSVLNNLLQPVVPGCIGELCIAGVCVGQGYLGKPELTQAAFRSLPDHDGPVYFTGDLVRYDRDGLLHYVGRKDFQIKLRGLRIELGDIEAALKQLAGVKDTLVLVRDEQLIGYVVSDSAVPDDWRSALAQKLPDYMVPAAVVGLDQWPLTPNGKVDRRALPDPDTLGLQRGEPVAPRNSTETQVHAIWQEVLGKTNIGVLDNFFDLGGNSLLATRIMSRLRKQLAVDLAVRELLLRPTIADLAQQVLYHAEGGLQAAPPMQKVDRGDPLPLSFAQQRLWFLDQLDPGNAAYNMPGAFRLQGDIQVERLEQVFTTLLDRHESLRTNFITHNDEARQVIQPPRPFSLAEQDLRSLSREAAELEARRQLQMEVGYGFDLASEPLFRARLLRLTDDEAILVVNMHHIITDGWSNGVLMGELVTLYEAYRRGKPSPLAEMPLQYGDFAVWQRNWLQGDVLQQQLDYWRNTLSDVPPLDLPFDRPRGPVQTFNGAFLPLSFDEQLSQQLNQLARRQGATLYQVLLSAFNVLLYRYSGQADFAVGTPIANRNRAELETIIGFFVNTLAIRTRFDAGENFINQLEHIRTATLDAYAHQDLPFERQVDELGLTRDMSRSPVFQVMFNLVNNPVDTEFHLAGLTLAPLAGSQENVKFDLTLDLTEQQGRIVGSLGFNTDLFDAETIQAMQRHFTTLLHELVRHPETPVDALPLLSREEREWQLHELNQTHAEYNRHITVQESIWQRIVHSPEHIAVVCGEQRLSYQELGSYANSLAQQLMDLGVTPGERIGLCLPRHLLLMPAILGIVQAGGSYVPLDAAYPEGRLRYIIENAGIQRIVTLADLQSRLPAGVAECVLIDSLSVGAEQLTTQPVIVDPDPERLLYIIYTSGSTGRPKGTGASQRAEMNLLTWYVDHFGMDSAHRVMLMSAIGFDLTQKNLFAPLVCGATLIIPDFQDYDARQLLNLIDSAGATWINCAPSAFYPLQDEQADWPLLQSLQYLFLGGEPINLPRLADWLDAGNCTLVNSYGPTECTDIAAYYCVDVERDLKAPVLPIGRPNHNVRLYIFDDAQRLMPVGAVGELYIGGEGVGPGYLNNPELTEQSFIQNPYVQHPDRLYRTGDRVRYRKDGQVEYLGRKDFQIKIRGVRIEAGEIQGVINEHDGVTDSLVAVVNTAAGEQLAAWVVVDCGEDQYPSLEEALRERARHYLAAQMVPALWCILPIFPLTPNGKIDRKALPVPQQPGADQPILAAQTDTEAQLQQVWQDVLGVAAVSRDANFFQLGGHSLLATQVMSRIRQQWSVELPLRQLFEAPVLMQLAQAIDRAKAQAGDAGQMPPLQRVAREGHLPLSFVQQQLWLLDQLDPGTAAYNMPVSVRLIGQLNVAIINAAFTTLIERHETLRSRFLQQDGEPYVVIDQPHPWNVDVLDISKLDAAQQEAAIARALADDARTGFNLSEGPLFRTRLIQCHPAAHPDPEWILLANMHHIISDGWSMDILVRELGAIYLALSGQAQPLLPRLPIQYVDYAVWQRQWLQGEELERQINFWRTQLDNDYQVLDLVPDRPRPSVQTVHGAGVTATIDHAVVQQLHHLARQEGASLYMALLAVFMQVLHRYTGQMGVNIGTPIAGRLRPEVEPLIGLFINTVVISSAFDAQDSFRTLLKRVRDQAFDAFAHQALPFEKIVETLRPKRDLSRTPFYQAFFNLLNLPETQESLPGLKIEPIVQDPEATHAKFDLNLYAKETETQLHLHLVYNRDLFLPERMQRLLTHFVSLVEQVVSLPEQTLSTLPLDRQLRSGVLPDPVQPLVLRIEPDPWQRLAGFAANAPGMEAVVSEHGVLDYQTLHQQSLHLARQLVTRGIQPGAVVAVYAQRHPQTVLALLGILQAGAAFTMLDASYPAERLGQYVQASNPSAVLVTATDALPEPVQAALGDYAGTAWSISELLAADTQGDQPLPAYDAERLAYIAYTSGTTGLPKAIQGTFNPVVHFAHWYQDRFALTAEDRFTMLSGLAHDPLLRDVFTPLLTGASLIIPSVQQMADPGALLDWFKTHRISVTHLTPAMAQLLTGAVDWRAEEGVSAELQLRDLRLAVFGGDRLTQGVVQALQAYAPEVGAVNFYGATETPQAMAFHPVSIDRDAHPQQFVPLGQGIEGAQLLVINAAGQLASPGEVGEIVIRSPYLSRGYLASDEQQAVERFQPNPFRHDLTDRVYLTGDKGRYLETGDVQFLGRLDQQIKIRGFRVEPGDVQHQINQLDGVRDSVVIDRPDERGDTSLVGYVVLKEGAQLPDPNEWRVLLRRHLPEYMIPSALVSLTAIPLTPNGKLDKRALPDVERVARDLVLPRTEMEHAIAEIWQAVLRVDQIGVTDNFFDAGGHSLLATQIVARVRERYQVEFSMRVLFEVSTIEGMANYVETTLWARGELGNETAAEDDEDMEEFEI